MRELVAANGGELRIGADQVFEEFELEPGPSPARAITTLLAQAGISASPSLDEARGGQVTLSLTDPPEVPEPPPVDAPRVAATSPPPVPASRSSAPPIGSSGTAIRVVLGTLIATAIWGGLFYAIVLGTQIYQTPSESMEPTYPVGGHVVVNKRAYDSGDPAINDVVIFHPPVGAAGGGGLGECGDPRTGAGGSSGAACDQPTPQEATNYDFFKRVVAGPGETLSIQNGHPVVNGQIAHENFIKPCTPGGACNLPEQITIPPDHYFMMGDNRGSSDDSRFWGPVPKDWIIGKVTGKGYFGFAPLAIVVIILYLVLEIAALTVSGMKARFWTVGVGLFFFPAAVAGALTDPRPGSYWARRRGARGTGGSGDEPG